MTRNLARFDPVAELNDLQRRFFEDGVLSPLRGGRRPAVDVYMRDDSRMTIEAHLPDFDRSDITIDLDDGAIVIQAERHEQQQDKQKRYVMRETASSVYRRIALPEQADTEHITAEFEHGMLTVGVPLKEATTPRHIEIGGTAPASPAAPTAA